MWLPGFEQCSWEMISIYHFPGTMLNAGDIKRGQTDRIPALLPLE